MDGYMTLREASEKWGITARMVNYYCSSGRIKGAVKVSTLWLIPQDAEKPADKRRKMIRLWRCSHEIIISGR